MMDSRARLSLLLSGILLLAAIAYAAAAAPDCANGYVYPDRGECECFTCWGGAACDEPLTDCVLSCETNEGYVQTEYWMDVADGRPATDIAASYRTDYIDPQVWHPGDPEPRGVFGALRQQILRVHELVGNVKDVEQLSMVVAHGATQLMNAAFHAYSLHSGGARLNVTAAVPYYYLVPGVAAVSAGMDGFVPGPLLAPMQPAANLVEVVTSPRNPDGVVNTTASTDARYTVHDTVFNWPSFTANVTSDAQPIRLYSLSKLAGLSGSRLGWAFVQQRDIADGMGDYIYYSTHGITVDAQYRAATVLQAIADDGGQIFGYVRKELQRRWDEVYAAFERQPAPTFSIAGQRGFPVLWIECGGVAANCADVFAQAGMLVRGGSEFGETKQQYVRLNMMVHSVTWEEVSRRLLALLTSPPERLERLVRTARNANVFRPRYSS